MKKHILVLHDMVGAQAPPDEQDTLVQVAQVESALRRAGYDVSLEAFNGDLTDLSQVLKTHQFDLVFNLVETYYGSRFLHTIPLLCEQLGIRVTGGNSHSLFLSGDKVLAKKLMRLAGIPTPDWIDPHSPSTWESFIGKTLICKPRGEDASVGIDDASVFTCQSFVELKKRMKEAEYRNMLLERYIEGAEYNVSISSVNGIPKIHPIAEIVFKSYPEGKPRIVGYEAKWLEDSFAYSHTVRSFAFSDENQEVDLRLRQVVETCWQLFDCTGYARVDLRCDDMGNPFVLELNMNPCLSQDSGFIAACAQEGLSYDQTIVQIAREAMHGTA
ncbi:MAG: D-alanine--D-alanine ligase family protein [Sphaerochaetaceae bacterium]